MDTSRLLALGMLGAARVLPLFLIAPFFGGRLVPSVVRIGVAVAFLLLLLPGLDAATPPLPTGAPLLLVALVMKEAAVGTVLALLVSVPFWAAEAAGRLGDAARGANLSEVLVPQSGERTSPLGDLGLQLAVVLFFAVDGHLMFLRSLASSFEALPLSGFPAAASLAGTGELLVQTTGHLLLSTLGLAAPVLAALFLADLALGLVNRVSPQIQVYFVGMPAKALLGLIVAALALAGFVPVLRREIGAALGTLEQATGLLR